MLLQRPLIISGIRLCRCRHECNGSGEKCLARASTIASRGVTRAAKACAIELRD